MTFRFLAGLGLGGLLVVDPSMLAEYLPPQRRGRLLVFLDFWWPVGLLLATGLSFLFLGPNFNRFGDWSWRYLFLAAAFPAFLAFVVRRTLPESPYFLARQGRTREAAEVLTEITGRPVEPGSFSAPEEPRSSVRELLAERRRGRADLDRAQHLLLRPLPLAPVRTPEREELPRRRLPAPDSERALAVPGLRGGDLAGREGGAEADAGDVPAPRRRLRLRVRGGRLARRLHHRALLRRLLQPRRLGSGLPVHRRGLPDPPALERLRPDGGRRQDGRDRGAVYLRPPERCDRKHDLVDHVRRDRDGRGRRRRSRVRPRDARAEAPLAVSIGRGRWPSLRGGWPAPRGGTGSPTSPSSPAGVPCGGFRSRRSEPWLRRA